MRVCIAYRHFTDSDSQQVLGWFVSNFPAGAATRKTIDDVVFTIMWLAVVYATRFAQRFSLVRNSAPRTFRALGMVHRTRDGRNAVFFAAVPSLVLRFLPYPAAGSPYSLAYHLVFGYTLQALIVFLIAAQADDQNFDAEFWLLGGLIPMAGWATMRRVNPRRRSESDLLLDKRSVKGQAHV